MPPRTQGGPRASREDAASVLVWDLPTRLFHWTLVALVVVSFVTGNIGGDALVWHFRSGYAILTLLLFRVVWGFAGTRHARFADFVRGPIATLRYARTLLGSTAERHLGHNPLGGWSVLAMLASLAVQVGSGLFANDDIATEGPLVPLVSRATSALQTRLHHWNRWVLLALLALHVAAVAWHVLARKEPLVRAMVNGRKPSDTPPPLDPGERRLGAAVLVLALAAAGVWWLVSILPA